MQPYLHNFSHFDVPTPSPHRKTPASTAVVATDPIALRGAAELQTRLQKQAVSAKLQAAGAACRCARSDCDGSVRAADRITALLTRDTSRPRKVWRSRRALAGCALLVAAAISGCGSSSNPGASADPAGVVPATAPIYAGADVRPEGAEKSGALAAGSSLTHERDPYLRLLAALQTPGSPPLDFSRDVAPWLGRRAGVFVSSLSSAGALLPLLEQALLGSSSAGGSFPFGTSGAQGAIVLDTTDSGKARSFLTAQAAHAGAQASSYRGVSYEVSSGGVALGLVHGFAVIGSESGMHSVIDTELGGPALAAASGYAKLLAAAPPEALAHLYMNPVGATAEAAGPQGASGLLGLLGGAREANVSLLAKTGTLKLYVDALTAAGATTPGGLLSAGAEGARALEELPGNSWLALGLGDLGSTLGEDVLGLRELATLLTGASGASAGGLSVTGLIEGLLTPLAALGANSAEAHQAFASWMGSGGVYASGSGLLELKAAVVIESKNPTLSRAAVAKLAAQLQRGGSSTQTVSIPGTDAAFSARVKGLPLLLYVADGRDAAGQQKFVLGLGEASVTEALSPSGTLASSAVRSAAAATLGEGLSPSIIFEVPTLLSLLEGVGLTEDPSISKAVPYLRAITGVAGGGHALSAEVERFQLALGLR